MSVTAIELFSSVIISGALAKLAAMPFPDIREVRLWLRKANDIVDGKHVNWEDLGMDVIDRELLLRRSYQNRLLHVRHVRQMLASTLGENLDRSLDIEAAEVLRSIIDEIKLGNVTEAEIGHTANSLEDMIYWIYNGHSRNEDPSVLALTG
jgi:hypothetical protein